MSILVLVPDHSDLMRFAWRRLAVGATLRCLSNVQFVDPAYDAVVVCDVELGHVPACLAAYAGPVYGVSIGIGPDCGGLGIFDHIYVRTAIDQAAALEHGADPANVTLAPDLGLCTLIRYQVDLPLSLGPSPTKPRLGLCCSSGAAQAADLHALATHYHVCRIPPGPADHAEVPGTTLLSDYAPISLNRACGTMVGMVTTHRLGVLLAIASGLPCAAVADQGLQKLGIPYCATVEEAVQLVTTTTPIAAPTNQQALHVLAELKYRLSSIPRKVIPMPQDSGATDILAQMLSTYLEITIPAAKKWLNSPTMHQELPYGRAIEVTRMFGFAATRQVGVRNLGQLYQKIFKSGAPPILALDGLRTKPPVGYCCKDETFAVRTIINMSYINQHDCDGLHRSGWAYVLCGMQRLDAQATKRSPQIMVDAYLDRSMLWGYETLKAAKIIPYKSPWAGFIHHTFTSGAEQIFSRDLFLKSIPCCRCLFVLTEYLADRVREALIRCGFPGIPVVVLKHPMAPIPSDKLFDVHAFLNNPNKKVVQIGAWLRNVGSIFELSVSNAHGDFAVSKAALLGPYMGGYYGDVMCRSDAMCRSYMCCCDAMCRTDSMCRSEMCCCDSMCRCDAMCRTDSMCKCDGDAMCRCGCTNPSSLTTDMRRMLMRMDQSVERIPCLSNDEYDDLLAKGAICFLNLSDASAVNTVMECIQRGTPLLVNRHPALEEVLGPDYPGFYDDMHHAGTLATSLDAVLAMNTHLMRLPRDMLQLSTFMEAMQDALAMHL